MYVPKAKREYGYYVLPLLVGDQLVGRAEPRFDRKTGTLELLGAWGDTSRLDEALDARAVARALRRQRDRDQDRVLPALVVDEDGARDELLDRERHLDRRSGRRWESCPCCRAACPRRPALRRSAARRGSTCL